MEPEPGSVDAMAADNSCCQSGLDATKGGILNGSLPFEAVSAACTERPLELGSMKTDGFGVCRTELCGLGLLGHHAFCFA